MGSYFILFEFVKICFMFQDVFNFRQVFFSAAK